MAMIEKNGYGQVEPNHLSAQRTGQIYAQTPVNKAITKLENGVFLKENTATGKLGVDGNGEWMLVYNEVKLYDNARQGYKDFVVTADETVGRTIVPRLFKMNIGDRYTTNVADITSESTGTQLVVKEGTGDYAGVGVLTEGVPVDGDMVFEINKVYTMPDGQKGIKVVRVK